MFKGFGNLALQLSELPFKWDTERNSHKSPVVDPTL